MGVPVAASPAWFTVCSVDGNAVRLDQLRKLSGFPVNPFGKGLWRAAHGFGTRGKQALPEVVVAEDIVDEAAEFLDDGGRCFGRRKYAEPGADVKTA